MESLPRLKLLLSEIEDLKAALNVLAWDQATYLPPKGAEARGRQMATLGKILHDKATADEIGVLLEKLAPLAKALHPESDDAALLRITRRDYERERRVPSEFNARMYEHFSRAYETWTKARPAANFKMVEEILEETLDLSHERGSFFPEAAHVADPLIEESDYGLNVATVRPLFAALRKELVPLVRDIIACPPIDDSCLKQEFPIEEQLRFGNELVRAIGYDFQRGRQDLTHHPFMIKFSQGDVRITTRAKKDDLSEALFSTLHEAGHALYEQGLAPALDGTPLNSGTSAGIHESQSRLWENMVGRSRPFWTHFYPRLQKAFPKQLGEVPLETFYRAINKVSRSLIRTDADEVTYNLHVMIRFDLEIALLEGKLAIRDLPEAWNARYRDDLGQAPSSARDGVLQDVHWFSGLIGGAFQGYAVGNVYAAQCLAAAFRALPELPQDLSAGRLAPLREWLRVTVHEHGRKYDANELIRRSTGKELGINDYVSYLKSKYGRLYGVGQNV